MVQVLIDLVRQQFESITIIPKATTWAYLPAL